MEPNPPFEYSVHSEMLVFIVRNARGVVIDRSLQRFKTEDEMNTFWRAAQQCLPSVEIYKVKIRHVDDKGVHPKEPGKLWCPYCEANRKFIKGEGYTRCEVCTMSTDDFYVKRHNKIREDIAEPERDLTPEQIAKREKRRKRREKKKGIKGS